MHYKVITSVHPALTFNLFPSCLSAASGDVQAYQIRTAASGTIAPGVVMASGQGGAEEATRKREVRLMKNRYDALSGFETCRLVGGKVGKVSE